MSVDVFVTFQGNCREAVNYYAEVFGSEPPQFMTFGSGDMGQPIPEEAKDWIMYTDLKIAGSTVMFSDSFPGMPLVQGNNITLTISTKDIDELTGYFNRLKEGGQVQMELQETFWSKCYGMLTDKYGIPWQVSHDSGIQFK